MKTKIKTIVITAIATMVVTIALPTYAKLTFLFNPLHDNTVGMPEDTHISRNQDGTPAVTKVTPTTPIVTAQPPVLSGNEIRLRAIEARLDKLEAKVK